MLKSLQKIKNASLANESSVDQRRWAGIEEEAEETWE